MRATELKMILVAVVLLFVVSCSKKQSVDKVELLNYISAPEHGLFQSQESSGVIYSLRYKPNDLIIEQELLIHPSYNTDSLKKSYSGNLYFILSLSRDSADIFSRRTNDYVNLLNKVAFGLKEFICLKTDKQKTVHLHNFIYPRLYGSTSDTQILLCFNDDDLAERNGFSVWIKDFVNDSDESLRFNFSKNVLENVPSIKIQKHERL